MDIAALASEFFVFCHCAALVLFCLLNAIWSSVSPTVSLRMSLRVDSCLSPCLLIRAITAASPSDDPISFFNAPL